MNRMLLVIDPQVDFVTGALPVPHAHEAMDALGRFVAEHPARYAVKVMSADRHPYRHCSFSDCGGEWPRHCVHDTVGAAVWPAVFDALYATDGPVHILYKGENPQLEEYSIFKNKEAMAGIKALVAAHRIESIDICGLAGDICVLESLRNGVELFGAGMFNLFAEFSPSIDGGEAISDYCQSNNISCNL